MSESSFLTSEFCNASDPWQYMVDSGLPDGEVCIAEAEIAKLYDILDELDEYHLAFALVIGERDAPAKFAMKAARFLNHESMSVRLNAHNLLKEVERQDITAELTEAVNEALQQCPEREHFADVLVR